MSKINFRPIEVLID